MNDIIGVDDLPAAVRDSVDPEVLAVMVEGLNAMAGRVAPCLADDPTDGQVAEARLVLVGTVKRWSEAGSGSVQQQSAGPFAQTLDTRQRPGWKLWPSDIEQLQEICIGGNVEDRVAFSIDTAPGPGGPFHRPWCALAFKAAYCSCGADIAGEPIYEYGV